MTKNLFNTKLTGCPNKVKIKYDVESGRNYKIMLGCEYTAVTDNGTICVLSGEDMPSVCPLPEIRLANKAPKPPKEKNKHPLFDGI